MLLDGVGIAPGETLAAPGVRFVVTGHGALRSAAPLGFVPGQAPGPPVLLGGDPAGLDRLAGLSSFYRTESWLALVPVTALHSWQLPALRQRLQRTQATLLSQSSGFSMTAPFAGLSSAEAQAGGAPHRLLLVGGGGIAALALFLLLVVGGMRHAAQEELERLRTAGARSHQVAAFVIAECALMGGAALIVGAAIAVGAAALLAGAAHEPVGSTLAHSLLTWRGLLALAGGWALSTLIVAALVGVPARARIADVAAVAATAALALVLAGHGSGSTVQTILLVPLCALAGGVVLLRAAGLVLLAGERIARRGPLAVRVAFVDLPVSPRCRRCGSPSSPWPSAWVASPSATGRRFSAAHLTRPPLQCRWTPSRPPVQLCHAAAAGVACPLGRGRSWRGVARASDPGHVHQRRCLGHRPRPRPAGGRAHAPARLAALRRHGASVDAGTARLPGRAGADTGARGPGCRPHAVAARGRLGDRCHRGGRPARWPGRHPSIPLRGERRRAPGRPPARLPGHAAGPGSWPASSSTSRPATLATNGHQNGEYVGGGHPGHRHGHAAGVMHVPRPAGRPLTRVNLSTWRGIGAASNCRARARARPRPRPQPRAR